MIDQHNMYIFQSARKTLGKADAIITKPDKGNGLVVIDRGDYFTKLDTIIKNCSKLEQLGPAEKYDRTCAG